MRMLMISLLAATSVLAQSRPSLMEEVGKDNLPSQKLGPDDLLAVSVYDAPELTRTVRVEPGGAIRLPLLREGVRAAGLVPNELEKSLTEALKSEQILVDPVVKVTVVEYHSRPISVMGAVRKPITFQAIGAITLLDALARAEGLTADAGTEILVSSLQTSDASGMTLRPLEHVAVSRLLNDADPSVNYVLHGGEEIRVPEAGKIFIIGNVRKPGAYAMRDSEGQSVLKLIALSEGIMPFADNRAYVYRRDASGAKQEIPVELQKILQRKMADVPLEVGDILYIPDNKGRRMTMSAIDRVTSFGASTASGVLIWRH